MPMEWHITDAQSLAIIDQEIGSSVLSPSEYELIRRVIYATADFDYQHLIRFSEHALQAGAAALAARSTIIVDVPLVQVAIMPSIQSSFANPDYCSIEALTRPQKEKTKSAWGMETLAQRYPEGIFVVGQSQTALCTLAEMITEEQIRPALVIGTPAAFVGAEDAKVSLRQSMVPHILTEGRKGNGVVAAALLCGLADLAWQAYGQEMVTPRS